MHIQLNDLFKINRRTTHRLNARYTYSTHLHFVFVQGMNTATHVLFYRLAFSLVIISLSLLCCDTSLMLIVPRSCPFLELISTWAMLIYVKAKINDTSKMVPTENEHATIRLQFTLVDHASRAFKAKLCSARL